jgi:hypothetical protein
MGGEETMSTNELAGVEELKHPWSAKRWVTSVALTMRSPSQLHSNNMQHCSFMQDLHFARYEMVWPRNILAVFSRLFDKSTRHVGYRDGYTVRSNAGESHSQYYVSFRKKIAEKPSSRQVDRDIYWTCAARREMMLNDFYLYHHFQNPKAKPEKDRRDR